MILLTREQSDDWPKDWVPDPAGGAMKVPVSRGLTVIVADGVANWKRQSSPGCNPSHLLLGYGGKNALRREIEKFGLFHFSPTGQTDTFLGLIVHYSDTAGVELLAGIFT